MKRFFRLAAAALAVAAMVPAATASAGEIEIRNPWARASAGMAAAGAAFLEIRNGGAADRLVGAAADVSETVELHTHIQDGGVMRMREVDAIDVPAGATVQLQPGGLHVMFIGLRQPLQEGQSFPLTLTFEQAGEMTVEVEVQKPGAMAPMPGGHGEMPAPKQ